MKARLAGLIAFCTMAAVTLAAPRDAAWKRVEEALKKDLPRTALQELDQILPQARAEKAWAEWVRATTQKLALLDRLEGGQAEDKIPRLEKELATAPREAQALLRGILAHWCWQYFQFHRWEFSNRTPGATTSTNDFKTWDLSRLFAEIDRQFQASLKEGASLQRTPVTVFDGFLERGDLPDRYRPTLFDFLAHEALAFYTAGEQAGARPEDAFELRAEQPVYGTIKLFGSPDEFLAGKIERHADASPIERALWLYRDLLEFHQRDREPTALADADLARLTWAFNAAVGEGKSELYRAALKDFAGRWATNEVSAVALHRLATELQNDKQLVEAHRLAQQGRERFPKSVGGKLCANLVSAIEQPSANITAERVWNAPWPTIQVRYRNVTNVWFRLVPANWDDFLDRRRRRPENLSEKERKALLAQPPAYEWSRPLPPTTDFEEHWEEVSGPGEVKAGYYFLFASHDDTFADKQNQLSMTEIWVSDLALVTRMRDGKLEGFVLDAISGEPLAGARVQGWSLNQKGERVAAPESRTDTNGFFVFKGEQTRSYLLKVSHHGQELATQNDSWINPAVDAPENRPRLVFFTDRGLYRPGQTVQFKGVLLVADAKSARYEVLPQRRITVRFADPNGRELEKLDLQSNDFGSFAGSFTAPRGGITGQCRIWCDDDTMGGTFVNVEEYKRPKFRVELPLPTNQVRLNETVRLRGCAMAYTGAAVDGAKVAWRVQRASIRPWWWDYWAWRGSGIRSRERKQEIAHGTARTAADGTFQIEFPAKPDLSLRDQDEPTFEFWVHADVTDTAGETRSADRTVRLGYTSLQVVLEADDWQTDAQPVAIRVRSSTLDDGPVPASGTLKVHALQAPEKPVRPSLFGMANASDVAQWKQGAVVMELPFATGSDGKTNALVTLAPGAYRVVLDCKDNSGRAVKGSALVQVLRPEDNKLALRVPHLLTLREKKVEPGGEFQAVWGTGYDSGRAFVEIESDGRVLERYWTPAGATQARIRQAVTEEMRGGFTLRVTQVRENRAYFDSHVIDVPWSNKKFDLSWEHFTSKLEPGKKETWSLVVRQPSAKSGDTNLLPVVAELAATLYDASLDAFAPWFEWPNRFGALRDEPTDWSSRSQFGNHGQNLAAFVRGWDRLWQPVEARYRHYPNFAAEGLVPVVATASKVSFALPVGGLAGGVPARSRKGLALHDAESAPMPNMMMRYDPSVLGPPPTAPAPKTADIQPRRNLNETAFFFPQLRADTNGAVRLEFTMPEALTEWRLLAFAHDRELRAGLLEAKAVTSKELMVQPNPPRFLREGDEIEFTVKVSNLATNAATGRVRLTLADAATEKSLDVQFGIKNLEQSFDVPAKESRTYAWWLKVPDGAPFLRYRATAATDRWSDGEEGYMPVLSRRMLVTESLPLAIRGPGNKSLLFKSLADSGRSRTLRHQSLTVQMASNPAWYAVLALPYLMEYPHECNEQVFNRYYANALARHIANADPTIRRIFDQWKATPALESPLEKNAELKSVALEETPWWREAQSESQARRNVGVLFDANRLDAELAGALQKLREAQLGDGGWSWFPGCPRSDYITLYIATGFGRLRHLGAAVDMEPAFNAWNHLDGWLVERHRDIVQHGKPDENHLSDTVALYLYGRSFFLKERPIAAPEHRAAVDYFLAQAKQHWVELRSRQGQGHLALALQRFGDTVTARDIVRSLKERSMIDEEMGRSWREDGERWYWQHAPIETQALMIEALAEVVQDAAAVEECRVWLLKQKQTQDWKTTKATADAVYALLLRGRDWLKPGQLVETRVGNVDVLKALNTRGAGAQSPARPLVEPGTGFYEMRFQPAAIQPAMGRVQVFKRDAGVAWGAVHWQYFEDIDKVPPHTGTPLKLEKKLFVKRNSAKGPVLEAIKGPLAVGDELVVRLELRADRDLEFVHLKDARGSGTEPVTVLSGYRFQGGLGYYESTRDTASHFFIEYLRRGTHVFEYAVRVQLRGEYPAGVAEIQCLYAPEFNSHSASQRLVVK